MVGVELFTIAQEEWNKKECLRIRRNVESWLFHPQTLEMLPPVARPNPEARRMRLELIEHYLVGTFGTITEKERHLAEEYTENANKR